LDITGTAAFTGRIFFITLNQRC